MTPPADPAEEPEDIEDLDAEFDVDRPVPIACQRGMPAWCSTGRHHRCYFTTNAEDIKTGTYGHHDGHVWVCPCPCHVHQNYAPCPHVDHVSAGAASPRVMGPVQINLF